MKRGSALLMALWIIAVLSVMVLSFSIEAKMQGGVNVYLREKNRAKRLIDAGRILGEVVLLDYENAKAPDLEAGNEEAMWKDLLEDDRWCKEKYDLKGEEGSKGGSCVIGPILLDTEDKNSGTVTVKIEMSSNEATGMNINELYKQEDIARWQMIYELIGITEDEGRRNFRTNPEDRTDENTINLQRHLIAGWMDYRDEDSTRTAIEGEEAGAEEQEYEEYYDEHDEDVAEEDRFKPANAPIADMKELSRVLCFQKYPAVLTGGVVNPWADKEEQITVVGGGLLGLGIFGTTGGVKINVNHCTENQLLTVPGIVDEEELDEDDKSESTAAAKAILDTLKIRPEDCDLPETYTFYPYKDFADLRKRVEDEFSDVEIKDEASNYLIFKPDSETVFKMTITARSMGMKHVAECECYVSDKKIRYISWKED